ncbi:hypothetical protein AUEXF2481DRAFT_32563 [Aureobasidium subglaciale EXF-2481]|uniref:ASST-domain-containing protein n=1 Tax=Aureobasidium subglaciale (strain EXF-2481) TaxID=1043005 RepID=A0A074Y2R7_AURSE|nr:uncharacterized protein AUEXF2481DRAFT_32563 [Aureobasidium subglaciale EXF-2481]KAI5207271.1 hypothetical protein E4T38_03372 [Aureobasidium subglaciale]KAI5226236.1 hypothetical protein E4T40_03251 [Aureobasidium subglaciale]KAI5229483.1 hypothetical protein E4T41_03369 [Aureobasidium subglaciale]KAI5264257.1 hypothetical protein E4T46_03147 [Aureobasidium subglaciale]KEQ92083.1 hypothetical protein AUEXF2481DRAFT_32563 [Aureobasidium subglaciale EXF-2481]
MFKSSLLLGFVNLLRITTTSAQNIDTHPDSMSVQSFEHDFGSYPYKTFQSSDLSSPILRRPHESFQCRDDNYIFLSPRGNKVPHPAVTIMDNDGEMVWEHYVDGQGYNFKVQEYKGEPVLTFWVGNDGVGGHGEGDYYMYSSRYEEVAKISALNGLHADLHEFTITPEGTGMMTIYEIYPVTLPGYIDDTDVIWIWDCLFQEIDLVTNELIFQWRASEHHSLEETYRRIGDEGRVSNRPWDWYHMNSIQKDELGNYLISARYTHTITYIDGNTGNIIWILGGKRNAFDDLSEGDSKATNIAYQHFARLHNLTDFPVLLADKIEVHPTKDVDGVTKMVVTAFDNGADNEASGIRPSRGVLIEITYPTVGVSTLKSDYTARLVREYVHPVQFISSSQGSMQVITSDDGSDPRILLGFGYVGVWTEHAATGEVLCDNRFSTVSSWGTGDVQSYRALKAPWKGEPSWPPSVAFGDGKDLSIFASWNGATEVAFWKVQQAEQLACPDDEWEDVSVTQRKGFETEIDIQDDEMRFLRVVALDVDGNALGVSGNLDLGWEIGANGILNGHIASSNVTLQLIMVCFAALALFVIGYEGYRQFTSWRETRWLGYEKVRLHSDAASIA